MEKHFTRTIRNNNLRVAGRLSSCSKEGQSQPEKPPKWVLDQNKEFFLATSGLVALIRAEWRAGTFTSGLNAMFEQRSEPPPLKQPKAAAPSAPEPGQPVAGQLGDAPDLLACAAVVAPLGQFYGGGDDPFSNAGTSLVGSEDGNGVVHAPKSVGSGGAQPNQQTAGGGGGRGRGSGRGRGRGRTVPVQAAQPTPDYERRRSIKIAQNKAKLAALQSQEAPQLTDNVDEAAMGSNVGRGRKQGSKRPCGKENNPKAAPSPKRTRRTRKVPHGDHSNVAPGASSDVSN